MEQQSKNYFCVKNIANPDLQNVVKFQACDYLVLVELLFDNYVLEMDFIPKRSQKQ